MKALTFVAALFTSSVALAYPSLNDYVKFSGEFTVNEEVIPYQSEFELTSFDAASNVYTNRNTLTIGGDVKTKEEQLPTAKLVTREMVLSLLESCTDNGGESSQISVPAGTFDACTLTSTGDETSTQVSVADVPFGILKIVTETVSGASNVMTLESYRSGN